MSTAPVSLHVYKGSSSIWSSDRIIKAADKNTNLYYLAVTRYVLGWKSTLHVQGQGGPVAIEMTTGHTIAPPSAIRIRNLSDNWTTQLRQDALSPNSIFLGPDGRQYCWKWSNTFSLGGDLQCVNDESELVASYQCRSMALRKDGELVIFDVRTIDVMSCLSDTVLCPAMSMVDHSTIVQYGTRLSQPHAAFHDTLTCAHLEQQGLFMVNLLVATSLAMRITI